jgi:rod shape-determining protein MreC
MAGMFSRHRPLVVLASVVLAQILLLAYQIKRNRDVRLIRYWAVELMTPIERSGAWGFSSIRGLWTGYIDLHNARIENRQLRDELGRLQLQNRGLESETNEAKRLKGLLNFRDTHPEAQMVAAQVIGASADPTSHTLFINRGTRDQLKNNMAVVTPDGIVGKLVEVFPATSQILLINDKESGVGALFAQSRTHGVVKGSGDPLPRMDYVVNDEKVKVGDTILTSGDDRIFPKGLLIGTVTDTKSALPFQVIHLQPATRLDRLEDVLILLSQQQLESKSTDGSSYSLVPAPPPMPVPAAAAPAQSSAASPKATVSSGPPGATPASKPLKPVIPPTITNAPAPANSSSLKPSTSRLKTIPPAMPVLGPAARPTALRE